MAKNLRHELRSAVFNSFREGMDKRSIKSADKTERAVWSYGTRATMLDKVNVFSKWAKENNIKSVDQIRRSDVENFLRDKANEGVTQRTVDEYRSTLSRLGSILERDWTCDRVVGCEREKSRDRGSESVMQRSDLDKICEYAKVNPSASGSMVLLEREIGVRVADICYGVNINGDTLKINSKGGRVCEREITPRVREIIESETVRAITDDKGHIKGPKDASVNRWLNRVQDKLGLERHSFHDIRRCIAQERYDEYRNSGLDRTKSLERVGEWLNHGEHRATMVLESYIGNAW